MDAGEKFTNSFKRSEWNVVEQSVGQKMQDMEQASAVDVMAAFLVIARKRQGSAFNFADTADMTLDDITDAYKESLEALGYKDDETSAAAEDFLASSTTQH